jgi:cell division GTPase FtsZ
MQNERPTAVGTREPFSVAQSIPKVGFIFVGNFGSNAGRWVQEALSPEENPFLYFLIVNMDSAQMVAQHGAGITDEKWKKRSAEWFHTGTDDEPAVTLVPLGKKGMGAGGKVARAEKACRDEAVVAKIKRFMKGKNILFMLGGGGGGSCGAMTVIAELAAEVALETARETDEEAMNNLIAIITHPESNDGEGRIANAIEVEDRLRELCPTCIVYNGNLGPQYQNLSPGDAWKVINNACVIRLILFMRYLVQCPANRSNADLEDVLAAFQGGGDFVFGDYRVPKDGAFESENLERRLKNPFQDHTIMQRAEAAVLWYEGQKTVWTRGRIQEFTGAICGEMRASDSGTPGSTFVKCAINEVETAEAESWMAYIAIAKKSTRKISGKLYAPDTSVVDPNVGHLIDPQHKETMIATVHAGPSPAVNGHAQAAHNEQGAGTTDPSPVAKDPMFPVPCFVDGVERILQMTAETRDLWQSLPMMKPTGDMDRRASEVNAIVRRVEAENPGVRVYPPAQVILRASLDAWRLRNEKQPETAEAERT